MYVNKKSEEYFARREAGGKGYNLYRMTRQGLPVPEWVVLGRSVFERFLVDSGAGGELAAVLNGYTSGDRTAAETAETVASLFRVSSLSPAIKSEVAGAYEELQAGIRELTAEPGVRQISVRSSAADEDSAGHSFARQLSSFLYVDGLDDVETSIKECWASAYSARSLSYRHENGLELENISVAVVLQQMIDPQVSGVMFTCNPTAATGSPEVAQYVINSAYGVGEGLVSGSVDGDTYWLDPQNGEVVTKTLAEKTTRFAAGKSGECVTEPVDPKLQSVDSLNDNELGGLLSLGRKLQDYYGRPQDIEWAVDNGKLYLLQTRPVTTVGDDTTGFPNLWDNSNIVESYGGITLPLTFTFALENYRAVYFQFSEILGVPIRVVKEMEYYLANMLGSINGRVFYNLYNWYKLVGILPGFRQNRQFMETMMGVGQSLSPEIEARIEPHPSWLTFRGRLRKIKTGLIFLLYHFRIQSIVDRFLSDFDNAYQKVRRKPFDRMSSDRLFQEFIEIKNQFLGKWKAPIINDFLCMIHFGLLKKLTDKWLSGADSGIQNDLIAGEGGYESAEPTKAIIRLAVTAEANPGLKELIINTSDFELLEALNQSKYQDFYLAVADYIDRFGYRCMSEMKMEERDLTTDPSFLFTCLKNYLRTGVDKLEALEARERDLRIAAETVVKKELSGLQKIVYLRVLKNARKAVKNRENTRFARTRIYGLCRTIFYNMGIRLSEAGVIESPDDIYYLTMPEVYGCHQGTLTGQNLKVIVEARRNDYEGYESAEPKIRFQTRGLVYPGKNYLDTGAAPVVPDGVECDLSGTACCPGIVEGRVRVIHSINEDFSLNGEILVAKQTDPGWVPVFPSISGLLVERGGLLSHSAIVAREMGIPAIVGVVGLMNTLKDGMFVRMDGQAGTITILEDVPDESQAQSTAVGS